LALRNIKKVLGDTDDEDSNIHDGSKEIRKKKRKSEGDDKAEKDARMTLEFALDLSAGLDDRIAVLKNLQESAEHTEKAVSFLLLPSKNFSAEGRSWTDF
jgi:hypothetical protein